MVRGRATRWTLLVVLLLAAGAGTFFGSQVVREHETVLASFPPIAASLAQMAEMAADIGAAQATYVAPGINPQPSIARVETLARQLGDAASAIRPSLRSPDGSRHLQDLSNTLDNLLQIDLRAREELVNDDVRGSAILIFDDGHRALASITATLRALSDAERAALASTRAALMRKLATIAATVAALWVSGLLLLVPSPRAATVPAVQSVEKDVPEPAADLRLDDGPAEPADAVPSPSATLLQRAPVDIAAAADVCTAIARASSSDQLPELLARSAAVLDASGIILWVSSGDQLFPAAAYGYDPKLLARVGAIPRHADNATALAWRTGALGTVAGGTGASGAIVAPLVGVESCIGVLAAEVRHGYEDDAAARAVTTMFAAQLAGIVSPWWTAQTDTNGQTAGESGDPLAASL